MKRSKHPLSHYVLSTFDMGQLIPVSNFEVLPGDSIRMSTSALLRVSPLMAPVMHPVQVRLHHWFVPYRILWDDETGSWEDFITGGPDGFNSDTPPLGSGAIVAKDLGDYFGIPPGVASTEVTLFPYRAYNMIFNEFYRDQDLQAEKEIDSSDVARVSWEKDYFTSARPWVQKGPQVTVPIGGSAPVMTSGSRIVTGAQQQMTLHQALAGANPPTTELGMNTGGVLSQNATPFTPSGGGLYPSNLFADLTSASAASVNDVRLAFALQRYQEARAQYGSRYTEYLRYLGVRSSDARLQRPEYLGGGRTTISFSEVLKTGEGDTPSDDAPIGELRGHGIAAVRSRRWIRFFEEHGVIMTLASIRPRSMYMDGIHRHFLRRTKEDYWQKELELIGQQEVQNREVFAAHASPTGTFGYQDRYAEYRHHPSYVTAEFRALMADWHLARSFASAPALNSDFIQCVPSKRIHAEQTQNSIWGMFSHSIQARRLVGRRTIGRVM